MRKTLLFVAALSFALGAFLVSCAAHAAQPVSQTAMAGPYSVTLKVLPAESFAGPKAEMVWDGGAKPDRLNAKHAPNHHMVVFVKRQGKPVEHGKVRIHYRMASAKPGAWMTLPVARMHVAGKGAATTHYGNNVDLPPGSYEVEVRVNDAPPHTFRFTLPAG